MVYLNSWTLAHIKCAKNWLRKRGKKNIRDLNFPNIFFHQVEVNLWLIKLLKANWPWKIYKNVKTLKNVNFVVQYIEVYIQVKQFYKNYSWSQNYQGKQFPREEILGIIFQKNFLKFVRRNFCDLGIYKYFKSTEAFALYFNVWGRITWNEWK